MTEPVYRPTVRIERERGTIRHAFLPGEIDPVRFGVHGAIAEHYGVDADAETAHATTIDDIVAATGG